MGAPLVLCEVKTWERAGNSNRQSAYWWPNCDNEILQKWSKKQRWFPWRVKWTEVALYWRHQRVWWLLKNHGVELKKDLVKAWAERVSLGKGEQLWRRSYSWMASVHMQMGISLVPLELLCQIKRNQQNYLWRKEFKELTVMKQKTGFLVYLGAVISSSLEKFQIPLKIHWSPDPWAQKCKELRTHSQAGADWKCMKELGSPCRASAYYPVCRSTREIFRISFGSPFSLLQVTFILFVHLSRYSSMAYPWEVYCQTAGLSSHFLLNLSISDIPYLLALY